MADPRLIRATTDFLNLGSKVEDVTDPHAQLPRVGILRSLGMMVCRFCCGDETALEPAAPPFNSFRDARKIHGRKTVICVAGLACNALENYQESGCWLARYKVSYCSVRSLALNPKTTCDGLRLQIVDGTMKDGTKVKSTISANGMKIRPVNGTAGIRTLNPGELIPVKVWYDLIDEAEDKINLHACNYDWRRWGDPVYVEETVQHFKDFVVHNVQADDATNSKASVICHSMGAMVALYCMSVLGDDWCKNHIDQVILVGPAHMGSPIMLPSFAHGPFGCTKGDFFPVPPPIMEQLGSLCSSWVAMVAEIPGVVGESNPWPEDYVMAYTTSKQYRLADMGEFLKDLAACVPDREMGDVFWPYIEAMKKKIKRPAVLTRIIYSDSLDTPAQFEYGDDLTAPPKVSKYEPGDDTITSASIENLAKDWQDQGTPVTLIRAPGYIHHKDLIQCPFTVGILPQLLRGRQLTALKLQVSHANDLKNMDILWAGKSDPYVICQIPGKPSSRRITPVVDDSLDPVWNYEDMIYSYEPGDELHFIVMDHDFGLKRDDLLGSAKLSKSDLESDFSGTLVLRPGPGTLQVTVQVVHEELAEGIGFSKEASRKA
mmetsp:Transcript_39293/g.92487  ORF Transcript_39293/g.92487 Transcript_39293/m.92487 type:complete len:602 (-) Transcript_39293:174-1979(-)|eukprot:CAMPEP_0178451876 /NCGR_PEP_ID=MMETSP0689_2-20121128/43931_1 /TAXON_ID=160604 /ORGANISM="Amphidinium massartii, Strain CS-259" /LENGTH=601 /DNA_ID=CAMNT_0020077517 /DNA_START=34 /DNA_END=1839 /DNA_ORIENTATION=+